MLRSVAGILLTVGHLAFATLFVMNLAGWGRQRTRTERAGRCSRSRHDASDSPASL